MISEASGAVYSLTFDELSEKSSALAARLVDSGIGPGQPVGVFAPAGTTAAIAHVAVLKTGAVTLPLVPLLGDEAIVHRLGDAGASALLVTPELLEWATRLIQKLPQRLAVITLDEAALHGTSPTPRFVPEPTTAEDPALLLYTSGTTGKSKGAVIPHRVVLARQAPLSMIHGPFLPDDVFWTPADWMWVGSLVDCVLAPLSFGCTVMTYERTRFDPVAAIDRIKGFKVTRSFIPPTALRALMAAPAEEWRGHSLRSVHSGGEQLTADAAAWCESVLGIVADEIFGMTEASFVIGNAQRFSPIVPGSMGRPFPGQKVRVADGEDRPVATGDVGELQISETSPSLFLGYHNQPEATAARMRDGWFKTGDLVSCDAEGNLFYVGRLDDLIVSAGHRIGPGEIEDVLRTHDSVRDAVVVGEDDAERGQRIKAVVQLDNGTEPPDGLTVELQDLIRAQVGRHAYPRSVEYVSDFPRTPTGKVRRDLLRKGWAAAARLQA